MNKNLEVIGIDKKQLRDAINDNSYWKNGLAPLSKSKAIWIVSNDRIEEDDYCGVMGIENGKMIAFIAMFPDYINTKGKDAKKAYWMNDWWVCEKYKDSVLGTYTYNQALILADKQVIIKAYTENVNEFYEKQPYKVIAKRLRYTVFFSLDASMLIGKFPLFKFYRPFINAVDFISSAIIRYINNLKINKITDSLIYEYVNALDNNAWEFIKPFCENDLIYKTKEYVNWQINNNQYIQTPISNKIPCQNLQTGASFNIHIHNLKIILEGETIGFLSFVINYKELNVKYFIANEKHYNLCVNALIEHVIKLKINFIFTDDTKLVENIKKRYFTFYIYKVLKKGLAHNNINFNFDGLNMFNRDGHFY